jgi:hypothetical protein
MTALAGSPHSVSGWLLYVRFVFEIVGLLLAIRIYRLRGSRAFALLVWAFSCLVVTQIGLVAFTAIHGYGHPQLSRFFWIYFGDPISLIVFFALTILSLIFFLREPIPIPHLASNQAMKRIATRMETQLSMIRHLQPRSASLSVTIRLSFSR